jgi:polyphosphate kinase
MAKKNKKAKKKVQVAISPVMIGPSVDKPPMPRKVYEEELRRLQVELCKMQEWVKHEGKRIVVVFEGRDAAGKGGVIKRILERISPRVFRIAALPVPSDREKTQLYLQRYIRHLPAAGEVVLFDRSWYNRAGVERVMGFCTPEQYDRFLDSISDFERFIVDADILLIKYWLDISNEEQERRFNIRIEDPMRQWKLSPMDLESRRRWYDYSRARDMMFSSSDSEHAPWYIVRADDKKRARLNCITHLLSMVPYEEIPREDIKLPKRDETRAYDDISPIMSRNFVPEKF